MGIRLQSMTVVKLTWKKEQTQKKKMVKKMEKCCTN